MSGIAKRPARQLRLFRQTVQRLFKGGTDHRPVFEPLSQPFHLAGGQIQRQRRAAAQRQAHGRQADRFEQIHRRAGVFPTQAQQQPMDRPMGKGAQKGVFAVDLFQIALHELHALQGRTAQQRRIIRRDRKLVGGEFGPVQPKEAVYAALDGGTPEHIGGLEQPGQDPPLKDAHRPQLLPHPAKAFIVQLAQRPCFQRRRRVLRGGKALQRCAQHHLQRAQHLPGHFHRQGSAPFPRILNRHPAKQLR